MKIILIFTLAYFLYNVDCKSGVPKSLAFAFDTTSSMQPDLNKAKEGAKRILEKVQQSKSTDISEFVFVPFNDPQVGPTTRTKDIGQIIDILGNIIADNGGDCAEMSLTGIQQALTYSLPNSYILVFTDSTAKDKFAINEVLSLIQQKQCKVYFLITHDTQVCSHEILDPLYTEIAKVSSGQIFDLAKDDVDKVISSIFSLIENNPVYMLSVDSKYSSMTYDLPIDNKLQQFTISLSGKSPSITVMNPDGYPQQYETLLSIDNAKIIRMTNPNPGKWKVKADCQSNFTIRITGIGEYDFDHVYSTDRQLTPQSIVPQLLIDVPYYVFINVSNNDANVNFYSCDVVRLDGYVIQSFPLTEINPSLYMGQFVPHTQSYYLRINGTNKAMPNIPIVRISSHADTVIIPVPPTTTTTTTTTSPATPTTPTTPAPISTTTTTVKPIPILPGVIKVDVIGSFKIKTQLVDKDPDFDDCINKNFNCTKPIQKY